MIEGNQNKQILLSESSKEELVDEIFRLRDKIKELEEKLQEKNASNIFGKERKERKKRWKKLGRPEGHRGCTRAKPEHIDEEVHQRLSECPQCKNHTLSELPSQREEHIQEDIIPASVRATKFIRHQYWCSHCKQKVSAGYAPQEVPYGYLGPNILIEALLMKYRHGLSYGSMKAAFACFHGLKVTDSALAQALQRISRWLNVEEQQIVTAIRASPYVHMDETGWKIAGTNHWLWTAVNRRLALYRIRRSRGRKVPQEILGQEYGGIVLSDFLSAYDRAGKRRQRCLVHLLRELHRCRQMDRSQEYYRYYKKLRRIIADAKRLDKQRLSLAVPVFFRRLRLLKERLFDFSCTAFTNKHWQRLSKRLLKYNQELLTFLEVPGLPSDNNHAERMIRPNVIFRNISFQNMSAKGARAHETSMSLLQTMRLQNRDPLAFFKRAYLAHRQGNPAPLLSF